MIDDEDTVGPPGRWVCPTCGFMLTTAILRASDGAVGVNRRPVEDICPNDGSSLRPGLPDAANEKAWLLYQQLPEMKRLNAAIEGVES